MFLRESKEGLILRTALTKDRTFFRVYPRRPLEERRKKFDKFCWHIMEWRGILRDSRENVNINSHSSSSSCILKQTVLPTLSLSPFLFPHVRESRDIKKQNVKIFSHLFLSRWERENKRNPTQFDRASPSFAVAFIKNSHLGMGERERERERESVVYQPSTDI